MMTICIVIESMIKTYMSEFIFIQFL